MIKLKQPALVTARPSGTFANLLQKLEAELTRQTKICQTRERGSELLDFGWTDADTERKGKLRGTTVDSPQVALWFHFKQANTLV